MRLMFFISSFLLVAVCGCSQSQTIPSGHPLVREQITEWPKDWAVLLGQVVTVEGRAANAQLGALLQCKEDAIWIEALDSWPEGFSTMENQGKRLRVTGTVTRNADVPVHVPMPGEPPRAGNPVRAEELDKAKWRYLLKEAKWVVLD